MYRCKKILFFVFFIAVAFDFQACSSIPLNLSIAKEEIIKYHESGRYDKDAAESVDKAIKDFKDIKADTKSAVVFDIDETALSNYEYNKEYDFGYVPELWDKWISKAAAPANKEVKRLYDYLIKRGFSVIFISGRKDYQYEATYRNLVNSGYLKFDTLIVRSPSELSMTALEYKSAKRTTLVKMGFIIDGDVGDQVSDLDGPYHGIKVKIPNYQYIIK